MEPRVTGSNPVVPSERLMETSTVFLIFIVLLMNKKIMKKIILIILVIVVIILGFLAWQYKFGNMGKGRGDETNNSQILDALISLEESGVDNPYYNTDDWSVYRNEKYGFTIKYPPGWSYSERREAPTPGQHSPPFKLDYINFFGPSAELYRGQSLSYKTFEINEASLDEIIDYYGNSGTNKSFVKLSEEKVGDILIANYTLNFGDNEIGKQDLYIFERKGFTYIFFTDSLFAKQMIESLVFFK